VHPVEEKLVEQLAGLERGGQLGESRVAVGAAGEHTTALTPQAQVIDRAQGITGVWVAPLFCGVDEVEGHVSRDEGNLGG
jgi:hypothetical protein